MGLDGGPWIGAKSRRDNERTQSRDHNGVSERSRVERFYLWLTIAMGILGFGVVLSAYHVADGDLWAKLSLGASVWLRGKVPAHDTFAFTPTLPRYIDHEWGAGTLFYGL